jgi:hypothetical protein
LKAISAYKVAFGAQIDKELSKFMFFVIDGRMRFHKTTLVLPYVTS